MQEVEDKTGLIRRFLQMRENVDAISAASRRDQDHQLPPI